MYVTVCLETVTYMFYLQIFYITTQWVLLDFIIMAVIYVYILPFGDKLHAA
jgi:hypothetical protein